MDEIEARVGNLEVRLVRSEERHDHMDSDLAEIKRDVKAIRSRTDRWSGIVGLLTISLPAVVAAIVGWFVGKGQ